MWGMREKFTRIRRNLLEDSGECYHFKILEMLEKIPEMFTRIPRNLLEYSGECHHFKIPEMLEKIPGNVEEDSRKY